MDMKFDKKAELLFSITKKDFKIDFFSGTGSGGQYRNRKKNCVRLYHIASGVLVTGQSNRDRKSNIKEALTNLVNHPRFKIWHARRVNEILTRKTLDQLIDEMMQPQNLKIEYYEDGIWKKEENVKS